MVQHMKASKPGCESPRVEVLDTTLSRVPDIVQKAIRGAVSLAPISTVRRSGPSAPAPSLERNHMVPMVQPQIKQSRARLSVAGAASLGKPDNRTEKQTRDCAFACCPIIEDGVAPLFR